MEREEFKEDIESMITQFVVLFLVVTLFSSLIGAACVLGFMKYHRGAAAKKLAEAQLNPNFRFADTHDPSSTAGGIPSSNPIGDDVMQEDSPKKTEEVLQTDADPDVMMTDRGFGTDRGLVNDIAARRELYLK